MALPSTGPISLANVNVELGLSSTTNISLNQTAVRTLAGKSSGTISMADLRGKSNVITLTAGYDEYDVTGGSSQYVGFTQGYRLSPLLGSMSNKAFVGGSTITDLYYDEFTEYVDGNYNQFINQVTIEVNNNVGNSGWTNLVINGTTFTRASAYYTAYSGSSWTWFYPSSNPFVTNTTLTWN